MAHLRAHEVIFFLKYRFAAKIKIRIWAFHGEKDEAVFCEESRKMVDAVNANGGEAKLTIYAGGLHNAWTDTFRNPEVWKWLLAHKVDYANAKSKYDNVEQFG